MCLVVFHFFWFPTFRSLLPSANEQLWPRIPDVSSHQEQHWWPDNQDPGEEQHHQQRPSPGSTGQGSRRWLARTSGLWQRKWDVRGVKTVDQGSSSYHGGPYCLYSCYVRWRKHQFNLLSLECRSLLLSLSKSPTSICWSPGEPSVAVSSFVNVSLGRTARLRCETFNVPNVSVRPIFFPCQCLHYNVQTSIHSSIHTQSCQ